jgi:hypothetical protein
MTWSELARVVSAFFSDLPATLPDGSSLRIVSVGEGSQVKWIYLLSSGSWLERLLCKDKQAVDGGLRPG